MTAVIFVSFSLGILFKQIFNIDWSLVLLVFLTSVFLFFYFWNHNRYLSKIVLVVAITFGLGFVRMQLAEVSLDKNFLKNVGQKIYVEGRVIDEPDRRDTSTRYVIEIDNQKERLLVVAERFPELQYGDHISVSGKLDLPKNFITQNDIEFDYVSYLAKDNIFYLIYRPDIKIIEHNQGNILVANLYKLKNNFIKNISNIIPEPNSSLIGGLLFGSKQSLGSKLLDDFKKVGLIHIVVLSGYNITIIATSIFFLFSKLVKRNINFLISVAVILSFALMVGLSATVIRATIMALIALLARFLVRPTDTLRWLFIAGILMLLWNPMFLLNDPSFRLSFMATLGLILLSGKIEKFIVNSKLNKYIPNVAGFKEILASTLAVQLFLLPILIKMSGMFSPISFFINLLILPILPLTMFTGFITGLLGFLPLVGYYASYPFGAITYYLTEIIIKTTEVFASSFAASIKVGILPTYMIFVCYIGYAIFIFKYKDR